MTNAKAEFISETEHSDVVACEVTFTFAGQPALSFTLYPGYSKDDYLNLLSFLDREYDDGYGGQELHGYIWYADGTWSDRSEYDGSEWWDTHIRAALPVKE
jgi:hypothetical protein